MRALLGFEVEGFFSEGFAVVADVDRDVAIGFFGGCDLLGQSLHHCLDGGV